MRPSLRLALIALLLTFATSASAVRITPAHSGSWYDPDYTSQGFSFASASSKVSCCGTPA